MNFPFHLKFANFEISAHLIFETLAFLVGFQYYLLLRKKEKDLLTSEERLWILIAVCIGALFFSRFIAVMEHIQLITSSTPILFYYSQKTMVGIMIGRIGCFLAGLEDGTYGSETSLIWGIDFGDGIKRHPTQIYEIIFLGSLTISFKFLENAKIVSLTLDKFKFFKSNHLPDGFKFKIFLFSYLLFRFCIEFIKPVYPFSFGLSFIQISCLTGIFYYLFLGFLSVFIHTNRYS